MYKHLLLGAFLMAGLQAIAQQTGSNKFTPQTAAQQLVASTGEDSLNSFGAGHSHTVISGYGEAQYQRDNNLGTGTADLKRAVLFIGHQFNGRIAFFSELEVEDAKVAGGGLAGEVSMEQAYLKFALNPRQYITAGLILPRIGIVNENHLPINFNGVERPMVEQVVIPSTWRELGIAFYGQTSALPLTYSIALMNGLNSAGLQHGSGLREARAEGQNAGANALAINAAVQYFTGNWKFQVSGYFGGTTQMARKSADTLQLESGMFGSPVILAEADAQYANNGITFKALACNVSIPEAAAISRAFDNNAPSQMFGAYAELGYNLFEKVKNERLQGKTLNLFARYETMDLNAKIPTDGITDGTLQQSHIVAGLGYQPIPNVVIKADIRLLNTGDYNPALVLNPNPNAAPYQKSNSFINVGIGYSF